MEFSRVTEPIVEKKIHTHTHTTGSHVIMEAEKSKKLQLASWRPRRIDDVVQVQEQRSEDLESQQYKVHLRTGRQP